MNQIIVGSVKDVANRTGEHEAIVAANAEAVVACDYSGSMNSMDSRGGRSRWDVMTEELAKLQSQYPGKIVIVGFSSTAEKYYNGIVPPPHASTNIMAALDIMKRYDGLGMAFFVISDGEPDYDQDRTALKVAREFKTHINTIYVGPEGGPGAEFLSKLSKASGGTHQNDFRVDQLAAKVGKTLLLETGLKA